MKYILSLLFISSLLQLQAQNEEAPVYYGSSTVPPSPTSATLGKYGDVPVSLYTGVPEISIPIYTIKEGNLSVPISLSYHSQGFKVEDLSSWVGLGWSLNGGGTISRAVKGVPDDFATGFGTDADFGGGVTMPNTNYAGGYLLSSALVENMYGSGMTNANAATYAPYLAYSGLDGEPDLFYFSFPGVSGQFVFDQNGIIRIISQQNLKITYTRSSATGPIIKFEIVDGNGNIYTFDEIEQTKTISYTYSNPGISADPEDQQFYSGMQSGYDFLPLFNSSWHLTKIQNATKNHQINLSYTLENQQYLSSFSTQYQLYNNFTTGPMTNKSWKTLSIAAKRLSSITSTNGSVVFNATTNRDDLNGINDWPTAAPPTYDYVVPAGNAMALSSIDIKDMNTVLIKKYNLTYGYFQATNVASAGTKVSMYKKLKLLSVSEQDKTLTLSNPPYLFEYDETVAMAPRFSMRQDFWGYLKATAPTGHIYSPLVYDYPSNTLDNDFLSEFSSFPRATNNSSQVILGNYDKSPEAAAMKSCIIKKITYPTGGTTTFDFEPHDFILQGTTRVGGGLRIKTITDYDGLDHAKDIIKNYIYKQSAAPTLSSGKVLSLPVFAKRGYCSSVNSNPVSLMNNSIAPLGSTMGSFVGYSEITVDYNGNGKTVNKFHLPATVGVDQDECVTPGNCIYNRTKAILSFGQFGSGTTNNSCLKDNYPFADNPNYDWNRGALLEEAVYDNLNRLVQKTTNEYTIKDYQKINVITTAILNKSPRGIPPTNQFDYWISYKTALHYYISGWKVLSKQTVTQYDVNNSAVQFIARKSYFFDNAVHKQLTKMTTIDSKSVTYETIFKHCLDYGTPTGFLATLNSQNRLNEVIEQQKWMSNGTRQLLSGSFTEYKDFATQNALPNSQLLPFKSYNFETASPVVEANVTPTSFSGSFFALDSRYKAVSESNFDAKDNLTRQSVYNAGLKNNSTNVFGHSKNLLIAQINNASEAECGFTSFESDDQNLWSMDPSVTLVTTDGHCGTSSRSIPVNTFGPTRDYVPSVEKQNKKFIFSCWTKTNASAAGTVGNLVLYTTPNDGTATIYPNVSGSYVVTNLTNTNNTWKYVEVEIDLKQIKLTAGLPATTTLGVRSFAWNTNASVFIQVDDVRFYPKEARMSSFTYNPSIGASSLSDENGNCQYYEYDGFGRLKIVKDQNGRILEKTDYNYKP